jgi:hypothetical protein
MERRYQRIHIQKGNNKLYNTDFKNIEYKGYKMNKGEILVGFDITRKPFLIDACDANETYTTQSDKEFLINDYQNFGTWEETLNVAGDPGTVKKYKFEIDGSWDYEHTEYDYKINLSEI